MQIPDSTKSLVDSSPFNRFILMEMERERLYLSFTRIDDLNEISQNWLDFSAYCAHSLFSVSSLANLLYNRYLDEFNRDQKQITENIERRVLITNKIENLQEFQMESAILMILYADIVNTGIFNSGACNQFCDIKIEGYRILDRISSTYFDSMHPRSESIEDIMLTFFLLNQKRQLILVMEESPISAEGENLLKEKGRYEISMAEFETAFTSRLIKHLGKSWWWEDPIATHFVFERALNHYKNADKLLSKLPVDTETFLERIRGIDIPINQSWRDRALIDHYFRLTVEAAKQNIFIASVEYLNLILGLCDDILETFQDRDDLKSTDMILKGEVSQLLQTFEFIKRIAELASKTNQIIQNSPKNTEETISKEIKEIEEIINTTDLNVDINYVSSLPAVYQNFIQEFKIGILENKSPKEGLKNAEKIFSRFIGRLEVGIKSIFVKIRKSHDNSGLKDNQTKQALETIGFIRLAAYFLPDTERKTIIIREIEVLECLIESIRKIMEIESSKSNEVSNLLYHAKAHFYSSKALEISQQNGNIVIPKEWIEQRYSQTFVSGKKAELRLFELTRQFLFLNSVIDKIANGYSVAKLGKNMTKDNYHTNVNRIFNTFDLFETMNKQIAENCIESLNHNELFKTQDETTNWKLLEVKKILSRVTQGLLEATKKGIFGYAANKQKDTYKSISFFNDGAKSATKSSELLQPIVEVDNKFRELAKSAYEYGLLLKELERKARDNDKLQEMPLEKILSVLKQMIFFS